jgi:hypothetical protein
MATATKKEKKKLSLGRLALVAGAQQTLSNLFWRLSIYICLYLIQNLTLTGIRDPDEGAEPGS